MRGMHHQLAWLKWRYEPGWHCLSLRLETAPARGVALQPGDNATNYALLHTPQQEKEQIGGRPGLRSNPEDPYPNGHEATSRSIPAVA